jgi:hypothetical protein
MTIRGSRRRDRELAGFAFKRPLSAEKILVPVSVELVDAQLVWDLFAGGEKPFERYPGSGLLWEFVELGGDSVPDQAVLRFARSWGVLGVCPHGKPNYHPRYQESRGHNTLAWGRKTLVWCVPPGGFGFRGRESVATWRAIAQWLSTLIKLAAQVAQGAPGLDQDWLRLETPALALESWHDRLEPRRQRLATLINRELVFANARLELKWLEPKPEIRLVGHGLYAALIQQLLLELSDAVGLAICDECKTPFRGGRQSEKRRSFCKPCRDTGASLRAAKRDQRTRDRARKMFKERQDPSAIASALGRSLAEVEAWVQRKSRLQPIKLSRPWPPAPRRNDP